jgi:hypothetical protein
MNIDMNRLFATFLCMAFVVITANAEVKDRSVTLRVKPQLCITSKREQSCEIAFLVQWESKLSGHYCLEDDAAVTPLRCWEQESFGRFDEERIVNQSFSYWLKAPGHDPPLAEARVELMTIDSSDRRRYRRNRHAWSIR